jgi:uncharacterized caspase-like protein
MNALSRYGAQILFGLAFLATSASGALADRRVALIIGNANYEHADKLANTINDADAMAKLFTRAGFDLVDERRDIGVVEFKRAVRDFLTATADADVAVVYYSGHGLEVSGTNYLIPVDAKLSSAFDVDDEAVPLDRVLRATEGVRKLSLIILDACRENPFLRAEGRLPATRAIASRLIGVEPTGADTLVAYAAKAGSVSYDGTGPNSPFTTALVKYLTQPGLDIRIALGKVRDDVLEATGHRQEPFVYGSLGGADIALVPAPSAPSAVPADANMTAVVDYQLAERLGTAEGWRVFLGAHKSGYYADLARAQLAHLAGSEPAKPPPNIVASAPKEAVSPPVAPPSPSPQIAPQPQAALQPQAAPQPQATAPPKPSASETKEQACQREAVDLARLRANPANDAVAEFARKLSCADLRPQVQRLMESLGMSAAALATPAAGDHPVALLPPANENKNAPKASETARSGSDESCRSEADELSRIRANPDRESAKRFAQQLKCDRLRAQATRLLESLGD